LEKQFYNVEELMKKLLVSNRFIFLIPTLIFFSIFAVAQIITVVVMSFTSFNLLEPNSFKFVGIHNYVKAFHDPFFWPSLIVTFEFMALVILITIPVALILALLIYRENKFNGVARVIFYLPYMTPAVVAGTMWAWLLSPDTGLFNAFLKNIGIGQIPWLTNPTLAVTTVSLVQVWGSVGFIMIIFITALQNIPREFMEAAVIDGANKFQVLRYITLPSMRGSIILALVFILAYSFNNFSLIYVLTDGGPGYATSVISYYVYQTAFSNFQIGYASALTIFELVIVFAIALLVIRFQYREES